jgi:hypothetical protein
MSAEAFERCAVESFAVVGMSDAYEELCAFLH